MKSAKRQRERASGTRAAESHRTRAKRWGREYEPVNPQRVFERDGWVCQLCHRKVPKDKRAPHPKSPTLDHIIPMSLPGGDHVYTNVQLAHFICNARKGATVGTVQLLLVG
jgi:5-methylcytosine-specific restriction endonuclease McrA